MNKEAMRIVAISVPPKRTTGIQCRKNGRRGGGFNPPEIQRKSGAVFFYPPILDGYRGIIARLRQLLERLPDER